MDSGLPDPLSETTTINMQPAFVYNSDIFPRYVSATTGFGEDTTVPGTGHWYLSLHTNFSSMVMGFVTVAFLHSGGS